MTEYIPFAVVIGTRTVNVDVPGKMVIDVVLRLAVIPLGAVGVSETTPVNPLREFTVIVEAEDPALMVILEGEAEIEKSFVVGRVKLVVTGLPKPVTRS